MKLLDLIAQDANNALSGAGNFLKKYVQPAVQPIEQNIQQDASQLGNDAVNAANTVGKTIGSQPIISPPSIPLLKTPQFPSVFDTVRAVTNLAGGVNESPLTSFLSGNVQKIPSQVEDEAKQYNDSMKLIGQDPNTLSPQQRQQQQDAVSGLFPTGGVETVGKKATATLFKNAVEKVTPEVESTASKLFGDAVTNPVSQDLINVQKQMEDTVNNTPQAIKGVKGTATKVANYLFGNPALRGGRGVIASDSTAGKTLVDTIDQAEAHASNLVGQASAKLHQALQPLSNDELTGLSDVIEGKAKPISQAQQNAANVWKGIRQDIHSLGTDTGMDIGKIENYFPHYSIQDGKPALDEGSFINRGSNLDYGNLVKSREKDAIYSKNPNVLFDYINHAYNNIVKRSYYGKGDQNLYNLAKKTANPGQVSSILDDILGKGNRGGIGNKIASGITSLENTKLGFLSPLTNLTQQLSAIGRTDLPTAVKTYGRMISNPEQSVLNAIKAGEISPDLGNKVLKKMGSLENPSIGSKWLNFIKFAGAEKANRIFSVNAGMEYASKLGQQAKNGSMAAIRELNRLGFSHPMSMTEQDLINAGRKISQETQFSTKPGELPQGWETPVGRVVTQFKGFAYKQSGFVKKELQRVASEASKGNFKPLAGALVAYGVGAPLAGEIINDARSLVTNNKRQDNSPLERYLDDIASGSSLGLLDNVGGLLGQYGDTGVLSTLFGAFGGDVAKTAGAVADTYKGLSNYDPSQSLNENLDPHNTTKRLILRSIPGIGSTLSNTLVPNDYVENVWGGVNNGLNKNDNATYNSLKAIDPQAAEQFRQQNQVSQQPQKNAFSSLFGSSQPDWTTTPKNKSEQTAFNKQVDSALANNSPVPATALNTRYFGGKTYDKGNNTDKQNILSEALKVKNDQYLTPDQKNQIIDSANINSSDLNYYQAASANATDRLQTLMSYAAANQDNRNQLIQNLAMGLRTVGGKQLFSTSMFSQLYNEGYITKPEQNLLSAIKYDPVYNKFYVTKSYQSGSSGNGSSGVLTAAKYKSYVSSLNTIFKSTIKPPSSGTQIASLVKRIAAPKFNSSTLAIKPKKTSQLFQTQLS